MTDNAGDTSLYAAASSFSEPEEKMEVFDRLPRRVRDCLNYASIKWAPFKVMKALEDGWTEDQVIEVIIAQDRVEEEYLAILMASPPSSSPAHNV